MANLNDDYEFIQQYALSQKQMITMDKWVQKLQDQLMFLLIPYISHVIIIQSG